MYDVIVKIGELIDTHIAVFVSFVYGMSLIMFLDSVAAEDWEGIFISIFIAVICGAGMQLLHHLIMKTEVKCHD